MAPDIVSILRKRGPLQAGALAAACASSRATLMRTARAAGDDLVVLGKARRTTYAARRALRGAKAPLPIYRVDLSGQVHECARLHLIHPADACAVEFLEPFPWPLEAAMRDGWFDGLPYPLQDLRPQGFIGRHFAARHAPLLQVDDNPQRWIDDDTLHALRLLGDDMPGDFIVGEEACQRWLARASQMHAATHHETVPDDAIDRLYPQRAAEAVAGGWSGSSAAGEFPKFAAIRRGAHPQESFHVLVKFSGADRSEASRRWADLLVCEHLALQTLHQHLAVPAATSTLHHAEGRTFLEVQRFDRHGLLGRSGLLSWSSLNGGLFGVPTRHWADVATLLLARGLLSAPDAARLERLGLFGQLIANSDMHDGNLSFTPAAGGVALAPAYDMLPMLYAPQRGVEPAQPAYTPRLPIPARRDAWLDAAHAALQFWQSASDDVRISTAFRRICSANARTLQPLIVAA